MLKLDRVLTEDGSYTLFDPSRNVSYRSIQGARTESDHVFVAPIVGISGTELRVFELGLGSGLNFIRTCETYSGKLHYHSVDHRPISAEFVIRDGIPETLLYDVLGNQDPYRCARDGLISLVLETCSCLNATPPKHAIDAVFHDPFGPHDDPESWTAEVFVWEKELLKPNGLILTYSAAGHVRRAMRDAGLYVASRPGPGRKREISVAAQSESALHQLSDITKIWAPR